MKHTRKNSTLEKVIFFLKEQPGSRPKKIADEIGVSRQYIQKLLAKNSDMFVVTGSGPNRFYKLKSTDAANAGVRVSGREGNNLIEEHFYSLTPLGEELVGNKGFEQWCTARGFSVETKQEEYIKILKKYYPKGFMPPIDFTKKLKLTFQPLNLSKVWAIDYYNFEIFGKTKMGTKVTIAKQTGDPDNIQYLIKKLNDNIDKLIDKYDIDALAFVSPTIQRRYQLMSKLDNAIDLDIKRIKVFKVGAKILIAQKTLKTLQDRILNARETFVVESGERFKNVLIIDDALGSGATLNELAKQIKNKNIAENCYGLVLVASPSGYEVINEV